MSLVYDLPPLTSLNDPIITFLLGLTERLSAALYPGAYAVEFLPILDRLPAWLAKWKREAIKDYQKYTTTFENLFSKVKNTAVSLLLFSMKLLPSNTSLMTPHYPE